MTKDDLFEELNALPAGQTCAIKGDHMTNGFGACLSPSTVKTWLDEVGLAGFEVTESKTTADWIFERRF